MDRLVEPSRLAALNAARPERRKRVIPAALAKHPFRPGQSGNPGGRTPQFSECQRLARDASPIAVRRLIELLGSDDERVALMAADKVFGRAWGKPKEPQDSTIRWPSWTQNSISAEWLSYSHMPHRCSYHPEIRSKRPPGLQIPN